MKSTTAQQIIDNDTVEMNNGDRMVDASTAYQAIEIAEKEAIERATRWISVEDELPEIGMRVLIRADIWDCDVVCKLDDQGNFRACHNGAIMLYPTHWRPIEYKE